MYITLDVLRHFGIRTRSEMEGDAELLEATDWSGCSGISFRIRGGQHYRAADFAIEGDWSAAANFLVAGAVFGSAEICGLDTRSLQADLTILDILVEAGASVSQLDDDRTVCVRKAPLEAFEMDLNNAPDLFPITAVLAAFCAGESRIAGVGRLASKESDRAAAILEMLGKMGVEAEVEGDVLSVCGESLASRICAGHLLNGGEYSSHHDHRMAMALKVASLAAKAPSSSTMRLASGNPSRNSSSCLLLSLRLFCGRSCGFCCGLGLGLLGCRCCGSGLCRLGSFGCGLGLLSAAAATGGLLCGLCCGSECGLVEVNKLDQRHLGCVALTETGVEHAGVSSRTVCNLGCDGAEKLGDCLL